MLLAAWEPTLLGIAALISAVGGVAATVFGHRQKAKEAKRDADDECYQRLRAAREESEKVAAELHRMKMAQYE